VYAKSFTFKFNLFHDSGRLIIVAVLYLLYITKKILTENECFGRVAIISDSYSAGSGFISRAGDRLF
jgi:hypothetical protein